MYKPLVFLSLLSTAALVFTGCENNAGKNIVVSPNIIVGGATSGSTSGSNSGSTSGNTTPTPTQTASTLNTEEIKTQLTKIVNDNVKALNEYNTSAIRGFFHPSSNEWQKQTDALNQSLARGITIKTEIVSIDFKDISEKTATAIVKQNTYATSIFGEQAESTGDTLVTFKKEGNQWYIDTVTNR